MVCSLQCACSALCCCITLPIAFFAASKFIEKTGEYEQAISDEDGYLRTPGNMTDTMWFPKCSASAALKTRVAEFNARHAWKLVHFKSKQGSHGQQVVTLSAWWLPAEDNDAPRIVLVHGNNVNNNDWTVHVAAYFLRSMGLAVLMPNLRDHGASEDSNHSVIGWAWDYYLDVSAAWEYAVNDPDGSLGGKMDTSKVGIYGQSMGGLASATAFGLLKDAPALWLDSAVFNPKEVFEFQIGKSVGFLAWFTIEPAWLVAGMHAGVDIDGLVPEDALTESSRPVAIAHAKDDGIVPWSQAERYLAHFKAKGYKVKETYIIDTSRCGDIAHISMEIVDADTYYKKLCDFWSDVFDVKHAKCDSGLPEQTKATRLYAANSAPWHSHHAPVSIAALGATAVLVTAGILTGRRQLRSVSVASLERLTTHVEEPVE
mmetsp:Transcript_71001/g.197230  ORF Transcript_71001/g.197230 Transcript_71001/m.197230 type:complete len:429 (-) Transcript_71001:62-1348(-)|eukprot:CAMPEP_0117493658 /NCGR_PEP_ID=MMETSP0784-20121206/19210_1 /TAXON_ID=39447 /ORGANISM="" /LENGTH=428 /DNA_ID=CAMNT_0005288515 /DNA_START=89 /DNA_END=1375 /DNA_ORIENTATION=-